MKSVIKLLINIHTYGSNIYIYGPVIHIGVMAKQVAQYLDGNHASPTGERTWARALLCFLVHEPRATRNQPWIIAEMVINIVGDLINSLRSNAVIGKLINSRCIYFSEWSNLWVGNSYKNLRRSYFHAGLGAVGWRWVGSAIGLANRLVMWSVAAG